LALNCQFPYPILPPQAEDDPISINAGIPRDAILQNANCILVTTPFGGHLGWTAGENGAFNEPWVDAGVIEFLQASIQLVGVRKTGLGRRRVEQTRPQVEDVEGKVAAARGAGWSPWGALAEFA
jgi:hypothetical protein